MKIIISSFIIILFTVSCQTYSEKDKSNFDKKISAYLKTRDIECKKSDSGLYYKILKPGRGRHIKFQDEVTFTYQGKLMDGTVFDNQKEPVRFRVRDLIAAWKEVMLELKPGAKAFLVAPPQLGYGEHKLDDIPQHSILIYEIKIVEVK